jgi:hypothetical protein
MAPLGEPAPVITPLGRHIRLLPGVRKLASSSQWRPYDGADSRLTTLLQQTSGMYFYHTCVLTKSDEPPDPEKVSVPFCRQPSEWDHNVALSCDLADDKRWTIGVFFTSGACHFRQARMNRMEEIDGHEHWSIIPDDGRTVQIFEHKVTDPHHMHSDPPPGLPFVSFCPLSGSVVICWATTIHVIDFS